MGNEWSALWTCLSIVLLTFLSDVTELAYSNLLFFIRTLRFWLYFLFHLGMSALAAFLLHAKITQWYFLAPAATVLGVGFFARTNAEIAGLSLAPVGKIFTALKEKMLEQAGEAKADKLYLAQVIFRLDQDFTLDEIESHHRTGLMAAGVKVGQIQLLQREARSKSRDDKTYKSMLIEQLIQKNRAYAEDGIKKRGKNQQRDRHASE